MAVLENLLVQLGFKVNAEQLEGANHYLEGINHKLELLAGIEIAKGLYELVEHFSHFADGLEQAAFQAGVTAEEFQKLVYAGSQFNVTQDQMQGALAKMSRLLQNARDGSKGALEQFAKLGISKEQLSNFSNAEDAFYAVQDALSQIPDSFKRVAATTAIFGRGAVALTKFASVGSKASRSLGEEAVRMGAVVSNEGIEGLAQFEESMQALGLTIRGFMGNLAGAFAPAIRAVVKEVQGLIGANSQLFRQSADIWAERIAFGLGAVVEMFRLVTESISKYIAEHPKLIHFVTKTAAILLGMSMASGILKFAFGGLGSAIRLISAAVTLLGGRLTLIMIGIAGLILGLKALWDMAHGKSFKDTAMFKSFGWLKDYAVDAGKALKESTIGYSFDEREGQFGPQQRNIPTYFKNKKDHKVSQLTGGFNDIGAALPMNQGLPAVLHDAGLASLMDSMNTLNQSGVRRGGGVTAMSNAPSQHTHNVSVNAPVTMNVSKVSDPKEMKAVMQQVADQVFATAAQRTHRDHLPAARR